MVPRGWISRWTLSSDWAARLSPRRNSASEFIGVEMDEHYLAEAIERTRRVLK